MKLRARDFWAGWRAGMQDIYSGSVVCAPVEYYYAGNPRLYAYNLGRYWAIKAAWGE